MTTRRTPWASSGEFGEPDALIDVDAVCAALAARTCATSVEIGRLAEVLHHLVVAADIELRASDRYPATAELALPEVLADRLFYACAIIFGDAELPKVRAFVADHLAEGGLLRLRPPEGVRPT